MDLRETPFTSHDVEKLEKVLLLFAFIYSVDDEITRREDFDNVSQGLSELGFGRLCGAISAALVQ